MSEKNDSKALKSGIWYIVANIISRGMGVITMPIFVRIMTTDEVGQFLNFTTWIGLLMPILTLNLYSSVTVAKYNYEDGFHDYISSSLLLGTLFTTLLYLLCLLFKELISGLLHFDSLQFHILFIYNMVCPALLIMQVHSRLEYKYKLSTLLSILSAAISTFLALLAVSLFPDRLKSRIIWSYFPLILLNVGIYVYYLKKSHRIDIDYWKFGLKISLPLVFHSLAASILGSFDKVMINSMVGDSETALYGVAYSCATVVELLWYSINQAWSPWSYEQISRNQIDRLKKATKVYVSFFGLLVFCIMLIAPEVLWLFGGEKYVSSLGVIPPVMCGYVFVMVYSLYVNIETFEKKTGYVAAGTIIAAITNIVLNFVFIPQFGYVAAAYTTMISYAVLFFVHFHFVTKIRKAYWYDSKFNILFVIGYAILSGLMMIIYRISAIRYVIIFLILLYFTSKMIKQREKIYEAFKTKSIEEIVRVILGVFRFL